MEGDQNVINVRRGVRQGCVLAPTLLCLYWDHIFNIVLENTDAEVLIIGEKKLKNIRYADESMNRVVKGSSEREISRNIKKTKLIPKSKYNIQPDN